MNTASTLFFLILLCAGALNNAQSVVNKIVLSEPSKIIFESRDSSAEIFCRYKKVFPGKYSETDTITVKRGKSSILQMNIQIPGFIEICINGKVERTIFTVPLQPIRVGLSESKIDTLIYADSDMNLINDYYREKRTSLEGKLTEKMMGLQNSNIPLAEYRDSVFAITRTEEEFLESYLIKHKLPSWFRHYEGAEIKYGITAALDIIPFRKNFLHKKEQVPKDYFDFISSELVNNTEAIGSEKYLYFLSSWFYHKYNSVKMLALPINERLNISLPAYFDKSDKILSKEIADVFKLFLITNFAIKRNNLELSKILLEKLNKSSVSGEYIRFLDRLIDDSFTLKEGDKAPDFYLEDASGCFRKLKDFDDKIILLNFWFPGCKPCIKELPFENELGSIFSKDKFVLINICFFTEKNDWKNWLKKNAVSGINLYAPENWQKILSDQYSIPGYPYYVLISKEGKIIKNNCTKPSEGLAKEIAVLLKK